MLGNTLKSLRTNKGLTQSEFSKAIGISRSVIGMIETTNRGTSQNNLRKIADFFNVSIDYLLNDDIKNENTIKFPEEIDLHEIRLKKEFKKLNLKGKEEAIKRIKELSELNKYQNNEFADELVPIAAHDKEGIFTEQEYKHDMDIMKDDDLWK